MRKFALLSVLLLLFSVQIAAAQDSGFSCPATGER